MDLRGKFHLHTQAEIDLIKLGLYLALDSVDLRLETTALTLKVLRQPLSVRKVFCRKDSGFWVWGFRSGKCFAAWIRDFVSRA